MSDLLVFLAAILASYALFPIIGAGLDKVRDTDTLVPPEGVSEEHWLFLVKGKDICNPDDATKKNSYPRKLCKAPRAGAAIGILERILSFSAIYIGAPSLIVAWLAFKVASKWQVWTNVVRIPNELNGIDPFSFLIARQRWGSWILERFWIGTLINILIGAVTGYLLL